MTQYTNTLGLLDKLIARLEANTGGQPLLPEEIIKKSEKSEVPQQVAATEQKPGPKVQTAQDTAIASEPKPEKKEKAKKEPSNKPKPEGKKNVKKQQEKPKIPEGVDPEVAIFAEVDLRVSEIVQCWKHPQSDYLYCEKILVGEELRQIASGLQDHIPIEGMKGKVIVMANLKPRPLGGFVSNGMVVCSSDKDNTTFELLVPDGPLGERLHLEGMEELFPAGNAVLPVIKKSRTLEKVLEHFKTDAEGYVNWKGYKVRTKAGYIKSNLLNGNVS